MMTDKALATTGQDAFLSLVERISANDNIDADKVQKFLDMQMQIIDKQAEQAFNASMVKAQAEMPTINRDKYNQQTNSNYSAYETILKDAKPIYTKYGFSVSFYEEDSPKDGHVRICADVMHEQGHTKKKHADIPMDDKGIKGTVNKTQTHAKGSSISYGRSYLLRMIFNIPTGDDDDGNGAGGDVVETITKDQAADLRSLMAEVKCTEKYFCTYFKIGDVEDLALDAYEGAIKKLEGLRK